MYIHHTVVPSELESELANQTVVLQSNLRFILDGDKKSKKSVSGESSEKRQKLDKIDLNSEEAKALLNRKSVNAHLIKKVEYFKI